MITRLTGTLLDLHDARAEVAVDALVYEVLVPAGDVGALTQSIGAPITFHTWHYLEGQAQGTSFHPRLIGFTSPSDRAFFELFITVKGIGPRKALRVLQAPVARIANAVAEGDVKLLTTLPEIGKRTAETIVVELKDKVQAFIDPSIGGGIDATVEPKPADPLAEDAIAVLLQLGESDARARELVQRARAHDPSIASSDDLLAAALRER